MRYKILQTLMDKIKGDEGNKTAEFKENSDNRRRSSDSCCGLELVEVERKPCVDISSDRQRMRNTTWTLRGDLGQLGRARYVALSRDRYADAEEAPLLLEIEPREISAREPRDIARSVRFVLLDDTAMDNLVNDCMAACAPTPRDYMKFAESKGNKKAKPIKSGNKAKDTTATLQDKEPMANEKVSKAGKGTAKIGEKGSKLHVTNVKIDDVIAPYLGIHDVDFRVVEKRVHSGVYHAVRSELEFLLLVADAKAGAQLKAREAPEHWRTLWTNSDQVVE